MKNGTPLTHIGENGTGAIGAGSGAHVCQFYRSPQDLLDLLIPYFREGLEKNDYCIWVTADPLRPEEARAALAAAMPGFERYRNQIEIIDHKQWYTRTGKLDLPSVMESWIVKEREALARGYNALRVTGDTAWIDSRDWKGLHEYESTVNDAMLDHRIVAVCSYPLDKCGAAEVADVMNSHQWAVIQKDGVWSRIENVQHRRAVEEALRRANRDLEQKVRERTAELERANARLQEQSAAAEKAARDLSEKEALLQAILDASPDGLFIKDRQGRYRLVNAAAARAFGLSPQEVLGRTDADVLPAGPAQQASAADREVLATGRGLSFETELILDGVGRRYQVTQCPLLDKEGAAAGVIGFARDVSAERLRPDAGAEERLRQRVAELARINQELTEERDEAVESGRIKSQFLANMSHEIRTPLNAVIGMAGLLLETPLNDEQREFAEIVRGSADGLRAIINDILDFSRREAGKAGLQERTFDLRSVVERTAALFEPSSRRKNIRLEVKFGGDLPPALRGDSGRLRQVLMNLLGNALKFTERGGVDVDVNVPEQTPERAVVFLAVTDTGIGIPPEQAGNLFAAPAPLPASSAPAPRLAGAGRGLAVSKQFVELMGGEIGMESRPGRGSTFWIRVPFAKPPMPSALDDAEPKPILRWRPGAAVLVAEDNAVNQKVIQAQLASLGLRADIASNGQEAIAALERGRYDLVLMDCQMPGMDGYAATAAIRGLGNGKGRIPVIAMTAHALEGDREKCLAAGMDDYVAKPVHMEDLTAVLSKWVGV